MIKKNIPIHDKNFWIGLNDRRQEGNYDGTSFEFRDWYRGEPSGRSKENCIDLWGREAKWSDNSFKRRNFFLFAGKAAQRVRQ